MESISQLVLKRILFYLDEEIYNLRTTSKKMRDKIQKLVDNNYSFHPNLFVATYLLPPSNIKEQNIIDNIEFLIKNANSYFILFKLYEIIRYESKYFTSQDQNEEGMSEEFQCFISWVFCLYGFKNINIPENELEKKKFQLVDLMHLINKKYGTDDCYEEFTKNQFLETVCNLNENFYTSFYEEIFSIIIRKEELYYDIIDKTLDYAEDYFPHSGYSINNRGKTILLKRMKTHKTFNLEIFKHELKEMVNSKAADEILEELNKK